MGCPRQLPDSLASASFTGDLRGHFCYGSTTPDLPRPVTCVTSMSSPVPDALCCGACGQGLTCGSSPHCIWVPGMSPGHRPWCSQAPRGETPQASCTPRCVTPGHHLMNALTHTGLWSARLPTLWTRKAALWPRPPLEWPQQGGSRR